jgi:hypothetical protein
VRRLRSASTMTFEVPFCIVVPNVSQTRKNVSGGYSFTLSIFLGNEKPLIFRSKFQWFLMCFLNRPRRPFLECPNLNLCWTLRFWSHFQFSGFPKGHPLDHLFRLRMSRTAGP